MFNGGDWLPCMLICACACGRFDGGLLHYGTSTSKCLKAGVSRCYGGLWVNLGRKAGPFTEYWERETNHPIVVRIGRTTASSGGPCEGDISKFGEPETDSVLLTSTGMS